MISIRAAKPGDSALIARFNKDMALETENLELDDDTILTGVKAVLNDPGLGYYIIAEIDGSPAGSLMITYEWSDWRNGNFWWIQSVFVERQARRSGVFKSMYSFIEAEADNDNNCVGIRLYVEKENSRAQKTYESLGMYEAPYNMYEKKL